MFNYKMKLIFFISFLWFGSCTEESKPATVTKVREIPKECRVLNDSAANFQHRFYRSKDLNLLDTALDLLNQAIACDSNYFTAWSNKMSVMNLQNDKEGAMMCIDKLLILSNYDYMTYFIKGTMFEAYGEVDSANHVYAQLHKNLKVDLEKVDTLQNDKFQIFMFTEAILYGKAIAFATLDSAASVYGQDQRLEIIRMSVQDIDKKPYLGGATHTIEFTVPIDTVKRKE